MGAPSFPRFLREGCETTEPFVTVYPTQERGGCPRSRNLEIPLQRSRTTRTNSAAWVNKALQLRSRSAGRERNTEPGNDYLDARDFASNMGRFPCAELSSMRA